MMTQFRRIVFVLSSTATLAAFGGCSERRGPGSPSDAAPPAVARAVEDGATLQTITEGTTLAAPSSPPDSDSVADNPCMPPHDSSLDESAAAAPTAISDDA